MSNEDAQLEALRKKFYKDGEAPEMPRLSNHEGTSSTGMGTKGKIRATGGGGKGTGANAMDVDVDFDMNEDDGPKRSRTLVGSTHTDATSRISGSSTAAVTSSTTRVSVTGTSSSAGSSSNESSDMQLLLRAWQNERHAPDILPMEEAVLGRVLDRIRRQTNDVSTLRTDENLSEEDHYMMMLVQTEVERVKFVIRSYVRTRLWKIEKYAAYVTSNRDVQTRLTEAELKHARSYAELVVSQFRTTVLNHLPATQQALDDDLETMPSMITEPDKEIPVFVRALEECRVMLPTGMAFTIPKDSIHLMRYRTIEQMLLQGELELV